MQGLGLLSLRLIVGIGLFAHGLPKIIPVWGTSPRAMATTLESAGISWSYLVTVGTGVTETVGGVLLLLGAYTGWVSALLAATTAALGVILYFPQGYFLNWNLDPNAGHGYEFHLLQTGALVCLALSGPGLLSYDATRKHATTTRRKTDTTAGRR